MSTNTSKASQFFHALWAQLKSGIERFFPSFFYSVALFIVYSFYALSSFGSSLFYHSIPSLLAACVMGMATSVLAQLLCERCTLRNWVPAAASLPFAVGWGLLLNAFANTSFWPIAFFGFLCAVACAIVFLLYNRDNETLLFGHLLKAGLFAGTAAMVLFLGLALCYTAFDALLFSFGSSSRVYELIAVLAWGVVFPALFLAQLPRPGASLRVPRVYLALMGYVALPLYALLMLILCGYVAKILVTFHMPSGEMNWYASFALLAYLVLWLGVRMHPNTLVQRAVRWGWVLLVPVVAAQIVGIVIRLQAYGLTTARYLSLACLAVGLFGLLLAALRRHAKWLFFAAGLLAMLITFTPLNPVNVPCWEQSARLRTVLRANDMYDDSTKTIVPGNTTLSQQDKETILSCYYYLSNHAPVPCHDAFMCMATGHTTSEGMDSPRARTFEEIYGFSGDEDAIIRYYATYYTPETGIPVGDYRTLYPPLPLDTARADSDNNFTVTITMPDGSTYPCDMQALAQTLRDTYGREESQTVPETALRLSLSDTLTVQLFSLDVLYEDDALSSVRFGDWCVLEK